MPPRGSPPLHSGLHSKRSPTSGQGGYITPATRGVPTPSQRGAQSQVAHKWARWLHNPCRVGVAHRLTAGGTIRGGPKVGKVPTASERGQNPRWRTSGQGGYITLAGWGGPQRFRAGGAQSEVAHSWTRSLHRPCRLWGSPPLQSGGQSQRWPTSWQGGYITLAALGGPHHFKAAGRVIGGPQVGKVAT